MNILELIILCYPPLYMFENFFELKKINLKNPKEKNYNPLHLITQYQLCYCVPTLTTPQLFSLSLLFSPNPQVSFGVKVLSGRSTHVSLWNLAQRYQHIIIQLRNPLQKPGWISPYSGGHWGHPSSAVRKGSVYHGSNGSPNLQPIL